jgi:hypothetical protein
MKNMPPLRKLLATLIVVLPAAALTGCSNVGNENPITPDMMEKGRQQENAERANFKPSNESRPPAGGQ